MKGLLIKDFQLLKENKNLMYIMLLIAVIFLFTQKQDATYFLVSFMTMVMGMLVVTTISYDDFDHGNAFLMTLPITRNVYVYEKYVLGAMLSLGGWFVASVASTLFYLFTTDVVWEEWGLYLAIFSMLGLLLIAIMIPIQLKFGADKGRIAMIGCIMGIGVVVFGIKWFMEALQVDYMHILQAVASLPLIGLMAILVVMVMVIFGCSIAISSKIMKRKQF